MVRWRLKKSSDFGDFSRIFDKIKKCDQTDQFLTVNAKIKRFKCDILSNF